MRGVGPRRTASNSDQGLVGATGSNSSNGIPSHHQQQSYNNQLPRKNANAPTPAPLLGMAPQNLVSHPPPQNHTNHHNQSHNSVPQNSSNQTSNGRHYNNSNYSQNAPHGSDNYYTNRSYRGGGDSR